MQGSAFILEGTEVNFDRLVLENSRKGLVLVDFWAPWVGPSLRQREMLSRLAESYRGRFLLVTIDTDRHKGIASRFAVKSLPALKLFRAGKVVETLHGVQPERDYQAAVDRYLVALGDKVRLAAGKAWKEGRHELAIQTLVEGAMAEPENLERRWDVAHDLNSLAVSQIGSYDLITGAAEITGELRPMLARLAASVAPAATTVPKNSLLFIFFLLV